MKKLRILLADDHQMLREGLRVLLDSQPGMCVVGEAASGKEVLKKAGELKPDVVVMDLSMPELNGLQATESLRTSHPAIKVVVLTAHEDESYLTQLCQAGAAGMSSNVPRAISWFRPSAWRPRARCMSNRPWPARPWPGWRPARPPGSKPPTSS
jgi:CheY-like chemotaxis protein